MQEGKLSVATVYSWQIRISLLICWGSKDTVQAEKETGVPKGSLICANKGREEFLWSEKRRKSSQLTVRSIFGTRLVACPRWFVRNSSLRSERWPGVYMYQAVDLLADTAFGGLFRFWIISEQMLSRQMLASWKETCQTKHVKGYSWSVWATDIQRERKLCDLPCLTCNLCGSLAFLVR